MKNKNLVIIILLLIIGVGVYFVLQKETDTTKDTNLTSEQKNQKNQIDNNPVNTKTTETSYTDPYIGLSMTYPNSIGVASSRIGQGDTGYSVNGEINNTDTIGWGSIKYSAESVDFTIGRGGDCFTPDEKISITSDYGLPIMIEKGGTSCINGSSPEHLSATVSIDKSYNNTKFTSVVFWRTNTDVSYDTFVSLLKSLKMN